VALQDKTEPATSRKREEAREEGQVARSADVSSAAVLLAGLLILRVGGPYMLHGLASILRDAFGSLNSGDVEMRSAASLMSRYAVRGLLLCLPIMLGIGAVGLASNVLQVGFRVLAKPISPDLSRLDPIKGLARLVSWRSFIELLKSMAKVGIVAYVVCAFLRAEYPRLNDLAGLSAGAAGSQVAGLCWRLLARACAAMVVIGILDYAYQRLHYEKTLRMTKQEVKEEFKRTEGDPHMKAKIRQRQRELARVRMMHAVPEADVVVTNPTNVAVALKYDTDRMSAPTVVAKGQRLLAEKIREIAAAHRVPIVENPPIARLLYKVVEIGQQIPAELYQAVAEILAFVYRMGTKAGQMRGRR
jgi:flagellar biosynthetic protein FlhB